MERASEEKRANKRSRAKEGRSRRAASQGGADWSLFDVPAVIALIMALTEKDGALRIGKTRDGGAWAFGVYLDDDYATEYIRPSENFADAIHEIAAAWLDDGVSRWEELYAEMKTAF